MFDTSVLDRAVRTRRAALERERSALLDRVVESLKAAREEIGIREAYVVGSLSSPSSWHGQSDVDVAVAGCSGGVLALMKVLEDATGRSVDVIDLDRHPSPGSLRAKGLRVYG